GVITGPTCRTDFFMRIETLRTVMISATLTGAAVAATPDTEGRKSMTVYVGTYTSEKSKGIYQFHLETGQQPRLVSSGLAAEASSPSFLDVDPKRRLAFAANEVTSFEGKPTGAVSSFRFDPNNGKLKLLNTVSSKGAGPCHLCLDKTGRSLLIANYNSG